MRSFGFLFRLDWSIPKNDDYSFENVNALRQLPIPKSKGQLLDPLSWLQPSWVTGGHMPHYGQPGEDVVLRNDMFFTIEQMINAGHHETKILDDGWTAVT